jgi:uncharacterized protein (DUF302 family)
MYGHHITIAGPFAQAIATVTAALKQEGFGVLSDIDIQHAMKEKLGVQMPGYRILGACNPPLAHLALQAEPEIGLLLPCNVTVRELADGTISVGFLDPQLMVQLTSNPAISGVADDAGQRLARVREALARREQG